MIGAISQTAAIESENKDLTAILEDIKNVALEATEEQARPLVFKIGSSPDRYAQTLNEMGIIFGLNIPPAFVDNTSAFNLIIYAKPQIDTSSSSTATSTQESEIRLVLAAKEKDPELAQSIMTNWEQTLPQDLGPMLLAVPGEPATNEFQDWSYKNANFRYLNLPISKTTLNYVFSNDLVIIGTSKNSIVYVFDAAASK